ncbi:GumC family protein [Aurantiacibacter poecillastricola]|uniref:GumC family protein n=1 Tax=Aurantiacibacter poecillastricola TaxID=3064385 RepID=UPI00273D8AA9|nr:polysaccharide biosynthesis tyrosine autokinase [Aurantiacibacter sp. 219JJ12-13]MDP5260009.1 polysaccharide biosynthesis tyrosine autokinase [Aurantiacibacter sp. 219JJ12-13]
MQSPNDMSVAQAGAPTGVRQMDDALELLLQRLWQRARDLKYVLLFVVAATILLGLAVTLLQTPAYEASSRIEISRIDSGAPDSEDLRFDMQVRDRQYYETQYELLQSRFLAERVVEAENLAQDPAFREAFDVEESDLSPSALASRVSSAITIVPVENSQLVDIVATTPDPDVSALLANAWAEQFLSANYDKRFGDTQLARERLESQLAELRVALEESEAELASYANENEIVVLNSPATETGQAQAGQETLSTSQLSALNQALIAASLRRIEARSALDAERNASDIDGASALRSRRAEAEAQLANLRTTLGPSNPRVLALEAEIESLDRSINTEGGVMSSARQAAYESALAEESELRERFNTARARYLAEQNLGTEYGILRREVDTNRELYDALLQRYTELGVGEAGSNNMTLIERASPPSEPSGPSLTRNLLIALIVAALLSLAIVYLADFFDRSLRHISQIRQQLGLQVLGAIPEAQSDNMVEELLDPKSELTEAYGSTRTSLLSAMPDDARRIVMFTSTRPAEGKTISSLALARSLQRVGKKVVLLDLDMRRAGLSRLLGFNARVNGLSELLAGSMTEPNIVTLEDHGVDFMPSGSIPSDSGDLIARGGLKRLLADLEEAYDYVIIDSPPVLGLADAVEIGHLAGGVVFAMQANETSVYAIRNALARLRQPGVNIIGALVTKVDQRNDEYGYGGEYGYGYTYQSSEA